MSDWISVREPPETGAICEIRCRDALGVYDVPGLYFLHDDGHWYAINPPQQIKAPSHWRAASIDADELKGVLAGAADG